MIYEYVMYFGYASIVTSLAMTLVSAFDVNVTMKRKPKTVTLKQIGAYNFAYGVVTMSNTAEKE